MKLSIITVCLNAEDVIKNTIESVLNQTEPVYEYIFVDGASVDNTVSIIESYRECFENRGIKFIVKSEPDKGISDAFNKGMAMATGDLIGIINADDELCESCVKNIRDVFKVENADIYYGDCIWREPKGDMYKKPSHDLKELLYNMILYHPSTFVKKNCYETCGQYDISYKYCMDKQFLYRCFLAGKKFYYIAKPLTIFRAGGISNTNVKAVHKEGSRMAMEFGEPKLKVKVIELKKNIRYLVASLIKDTRIYSILKYDKRID